MHLPMITQYNWFIKTQHLIIVMVYEIDEYMGRIDEGNLDGKDHKWIVANLKSLQNPTFEMRLAHVIRWVYPWLPIFEEWYNSRYGDAPPSFCAQVITSGYDTTQDEWLTPNNYLQMYKRRLHEHLEASAASFEDWREFLHGRRDQTIFDASDEELGEVATFLERHRPLWDE